MNFLSNKYVLEIVDEKNGHILNEIFKSHDFEGKIKIQYLRGENPFLSLEEEGDEAFVIMLRDKSNENCPVGMGACIIRREFIEGKILNVGYLSSLKIIPSYQKKMFCIPQIYDFLHENTKSKVDFYYTTILKENIKAQKLLEKKRKNMPSYDFLGHYTVYNFKKIEKLKIDMKNGMSEKLLKFYKNNLKNYNLSPVSPFLKGIRDEDFYYIESKHGEILAACAVFSQIEFKQYVIAGYDGIYKFLSKFPIELLGYPPLPKVNAFANYGTVGLLCSLENNVLHAKNLLSAITMKLKSYDFFMAGFHENNKYNEIFKNVKTIKYESKLYRVRFYGEKDFNLKGEIALEVGLL